MTVNIYSGATVSGSPVLTLTTTESGGNWSVTPTALQALTANAQYTAQAAQSDVAGNTGTSSANTFVIDTVAPTVALTAPVTSTTTPAFSGTAGNNTATSTTSADSATVTVYICNGTQTSCGASGPSLFETLTSTRTGTPWTVTPAAGQALTNGSTYTAQAAQSDGAGNTGTSGISTWTVSTASAVGATSIAEWTTPNDSTSVSPGDVVTTNGTPYLVLVYGQGTANSPTVTVSTGAGTPFSAASTSTIVMNKDFIAVVPVTGNGTSTNQTTVKANGSLTILAVQVVQLSPNATTVALTGTTPSLGADPSGSPASAALASTTSGDGEVVLVGLFGSATSTITPRVA